MTSETILMIASGMKQQKKPYLNNSVENIYLNYGLLGLGSVLFEKGYTHVNMFQGDSKTIQEILSEIKIAGVDIKKLKYPVFVSIPSFFAISWALEFISEIKIENPSIKVILGGRWVLDKNLDWCKEKFKEVDYFSKGCPDLTVDQLLDPINWSNYQPSQNIAHPFDKFNYNILNNFKLYQPVIEICRGCGRGCEFCLEKHYPVSNIKSAEAVMLEAKAICKIYETDDLNFYFEASIFNPTVEWATKFLELYKTNNMKFNWRFETRVDTIDINSLEMLSMAGLKVIDLGLESASACQLEKMKKCSDVQMYLAKADVLLHKMYEVGIWSKLNVLLYIGETLNTINETTAWLNERKIYIKGISVNPLMVYLNGEQTDDFIEYIKHQTRLAVDEKSLNEFGYTQIHLSNEISIQKSHDITNELMEKFMLHEDYLLLKNICYTKRAVS